ncbi:hypothetical protein DFH09DRAFT_1174668 [Mycena vulgaris]|nr:hypothetical protein DFH09DRAFT_1174668 [Mycena vulgaris]
MASLSPSKLLAVLALFFWQVHASRANIPRSDGAPIPGYVCPQADIDATGCRGPKDCLYPNPDDCHSYIQCNDGGLAYVMPCLSDILPVAYNDATKECDLLGLIHCLTEEVV